MRGAAMRVVVGGGTGFVGRALTQLLRSRGHQVTHVSRQGGKDRITWEELSRCGLPLCDAVVNLAGENVLNPFRRWGDAFCREVISSRVETTKALAKAIAAAEQPPRAWVLVTGVFTAPAPQLSTLKTVQEGILTSSHAWCSAGSRWRCNLSDALAFPSGTWRPHGLWTPALPVDPHSGPVWDCVPCPGEGVCARHPQWRCPILPWHLQWHLCPGAGGSPGAPGAAAGARLGRAGCLWGRAGGHAAGGTEGAAQTHPGERLPLHLP
ncbi:epimerase family protein SDR39U1 isoform X2 [Vidua macroura]|uniref:epimerase family protein SDR39U1 isoform X2 n=1 Tax=Vidua macroura TaxID=187451 RepID=UPI0023A7BFDA|nr:epimerase family protein SDR39U1 isoform X2 [Vidua macroura]